MKFEIPIRTVSEMNQREHWANKHRRKKNQQKILKWHLPKEAPTGITTLILTRIAPRSLDADNLAASFKNIVDGVASWLKPGLAPGRADDGLTLEFHQQKGKPKEYKVIVELVH